MTSAAPHRDLAGPPYGVAVDLGTTHIRVALWDRRAGRRIGARRGENPQGSFGADVLNRLAAFRSGPDRAEALTRAARDAVLDALHDILARDTGEGAGALREIGRVLIVGNTAMLALLAGRGVDDLLRPDAWDRPISCTPPADGRWRDSWKLPAAEIILAPPAAGFIGSDLLASIIATRLTDGPPGSMLMDLGTNTEIALWDGRCLHLTSVPGGPAFEGVGLQNGIPAETGAVCHVSRGGSAFTLDVIGADAPRGICATGLIDAIALLVADGAITSMGRFHPREPGRAILLDPSAPRTAVTPSDVDLFQRAKAATAAAAAELLKITGRDWEEIPRLLVSGAFGRMLHVRNAQEVGLLPDIPAERIDLVADATLAGCERALIERDPLALFAALSPSVRTHNVARIEGYEGRFVEYLRLRPIPPVADPEDRCSTRSFDATTRR